MNLKIFMKSIASVAMLKRVASRFIFVFGIFGIFIGVAAIYVPDQFNYGWSGLIKVLAICLTLAFIFIFYSFFIKREISMSLSNLDTKITIKIGNILSEDGHLVIGFSDCFDTEIGDVISKNSLQGKFSDSIYGGDIQRLDRELDQALEGVSFSVDSTKNKGKNKRYGVGTVAVLNGQSKKFFCCAYSRMGSDLKAKSTINDIWLSLNKIWEEFRLKGQQGKVCIPIIGSKLARVDGSSCILMIKIIALSFIINSKIEKISQELTIVICENDAEKINFLELEDFIKTINA